MFFHLDRNNVTVCKGARVRKNGSPDNRVVTIQYLPPRLHEHASVFSSLYLVLGVPQEAKTIKAVCQAPIYLGGGMKE